jgi:Uma2 family endonuclease
MEKDSDFISLLASYRLKRGRFFLWQPILYQQDHRGTGQAEAEQCQEAAFHEIEHLSLDRKYEYLNGMAYLMSGGSVVHDRITQNVGYAPDSQLRTGPCRAFGVDVQVLLGTKKDSKKHYAYPDATVSCDAADRRPENTLIESPRVVIEVLSPSTEAHDRGVKFKAYQAYSTLQEIVLMSQFAPYVEIWQCDDQDTTSWHYRHYGPGEIVDINSIDVQIDIADIYQGLDFQVAEPGEE